MAATRPRTSSPRAPGDVDASVFEKAKRASMGQVLFKCARLFNERALERVRRHGGPKDLRAAHTALFPHLELGGVRLTELARRMGVSKQATSQLVDELADMGVLTRAPDPADGRAKLIVFTESGRQGLMKGLGVLAEIEAEVAGHLGTARAASLREGLAALLDFLEAR